MSTQPSPSAPNPLPSPDQLPNADVVIFDGQCNFCSGQVRRLKRWDGRDRLCYLSLHDPQVQQIHPGLSHEQLMEEMFVVERQTGKARGGAEAVRYLSRRLPKMWFLAPLLHFPFSLGIWKWLYRQIAKRRYRISGRSEDSCESDACKIHYD